MRTPLLLALAGGIALMVPQAHAQQAPTAPPPPPAAAPGSPGGRPMHGPMDHGPMDHGAMDHGPRGMDEAQRGMGRHRPGMMGGMRGFGLIYPAPDRALSGADVQKIAEAFLLFNGNHSWKVTEVKEEPDRVTFALATPDGAAIAHFAMDRHTGRPERLN